VVHGDVTRTPEFVEHRFAIQDEASQLIAVLLGKGRRILDACAAPGGKTWSIADRNPHAAITAVELHPHRAQLLRKRVTSQNVSVITKDIRDLPVAELFDRVLADVPCSGTGTLSRHPEIRWRLRPEDLADLQARQTSILQAALKHVSPQGRLVYSTCSLEREENEFVIEQALAANPDFRLMECRVELQRMQRDGELTAEPAKLVSGPYLRTLPGIQRCDGFFAAILEKH
jgi:16S rRNA (cytosine967-C5)-methyltransferase